MACSPGCGTQKRFNSQNQTDERVPATLIYAEGWTDIALVANWAKTSLDHLGHFFTTRNACGKDEAGAISIEHWNKLATAINQVVADEAAAEEYCIPLPEGRSRYMDGTAEVVLSNGKKLALMDSTRGTGGCSKIKNRATAEVVFETLNELVVVADKEGCSVLPY
ncbi:MAG: hypothetical protein A2070_06970 [Bdellovibrionales bacterium GWC1_52_8]|nr:MAG: hypothetical protein A2070_06970 [Bdellovibrionales bacterium GWC1_52_8]